MVHEKKIASKEQVDSELDRAIAENKGLLKRLEIEEMKPLKREKCVVGDIQSPENIMGEQTSIQIPTVTSDINYPPISQKLPSTTSHDKLELELLE